jgi:hypothetical protein
MNIHTTKEEPMSYMIQIYQGGFFDAWSRMSEEEQQRVGADYAAITATPGVSAGEQLASPETATTVRVQDGRTLTTDGPFAETKEALGGYFLFDSEDLDAAIALAARVPAARFGGAVEVRPLVTR